MAATRFLGTVGLDDLVNSFILLDGFDIPSTRNVSYEQHANRQGRVSRTREDQNPLIITVKGMWRDSGGAYYRDFKAALMSQSRVHLILGDGTRYEYCDGVEMTQTQAVGLGAGTSTPNQLWSYVLTIQCYEPFAREITPTLLNLGSLNSGAGATTTNLSVSYPGNAYSEPTWQWNLVIPGGVTVTQLMLQSTSTTETCTVSGLALTNGTYYVAMDASGATAPTGLTPATPNNNAYSLLAFPTVGYGVTVTPSGGGSVDQDWTGRIPTLIASSAPTIPPTSLTNSFVATITATGSLTSASMHLLAPSRYIR